MSSSFGAAMIQMKGKVVSFSAAYVQIQTQQSVYTIDRAKLSPADSKAIIRTEVETVLMVPSDGILSSKKR